MNLDPLCLWLKGHLGDVMVSAFIYGSVATGHAGPHSDIDCFVITADDVDGQRRRRLGTAFAELQQSLGFTPDPDYPIEIFSAEACRTILHGDELDRMLTAAAQAGGMDRHAAECDAVEVLRALLDRRLVLEYAAVLDLLTDTAREVVRRYPVEPPALLRRLDVPPVSR